MIPGNQFVLGTRAWPNALHAPIARPLRVFQRCPYSLQKHQAFWFLRTPSAPRGKYRAHVHNVIDNKGHHLGKSNPYSKSRNYKLASPASQFYYCTNYKLPLSNFKCFVPKIVRANIKGADWLTRRARIQWPPFATKTTPPPPPDTLSYEVHSMPT